MRLEYKGILFDLFGTIVDNFRNSDIDVLYRQMGSALGVEPDAMRDLWKSTFKERTAGAWPDLPTTLRAISTRIGGNPSDEQIEKARRIRFEFSIKTLVPRHDAVATITELKRRGYITGLLSNCTHEVPELWPTTAFAPIIDHPTFSCTERARKPEPKIFEIALRKMGLTASECIYVADGDMGEMAAAQSLGFRPILIRDPDEQDANRYEQEDWEGESIGSLGELVSGSVRG